MPLGMIAHTLPHGTSQCTCFSMVGVLQFYPVKQESFGKLKLQLPGQAVSLPALAATGVPKWGVGMHKQYLACGRA